MNEIQHYANGTFLVKFYFRKFAIFEALEGVFHDICIVQTRIEHGEITLLLQGGEHLFGI